jgi:hypothetical protein
MPVGQLLQQSSSGRSLALDCADLKAVVLLIGLLHPKQARCPFLTAVRFVVPC